MSDGPYHARTTDPETSHEFAALMNEKHPEQWKRIRYDIALNGASTYREVAERTGIDGTSTSTAMTKMEAAGILARLLDERGKLVRRNGAMLRDLAERVVPPPPPPDPNGQGRLL